MKKQDYKIHIIRAGVSGLIAARVLEDSPNLAQFTSEYR